MLKLEDIGDSGKAKRHVIINKPKAKDMSQTCLDLLHDNNMIMAYSTF